MMVTVIKNIIAPILCSKSFGKMIGWFYSNQIPTRRYGRYVYDCSSEVVLDTVKAEIFWGIYESAEVRFIKKYLRTDLDVIELGASIGIVSTQILSKLDETKKLFSVEANSFLISTLKNNLTNNCRYNNFFVINEAISYDDKTFVDLYITKENVNSSLQKKEGVLIKVKTTGLSNLITSNHIDAYAMVCDIEGSEIEIFLNEEQALMKCEQLIIELHPTQYNEKIYNIDSLISIIILKHRFRLIENYGNVYYFKR